jgi:spore germination cell wall hydrolase CwlJ-like protein
MGLSRNGPKGALWAPFGLGIVALFLMPREIGYQELAALIARQLPAVERDQGAKFISPIGPVRAAALTLPQPIGTALPLARNYVLAGLDPANADITGSIRERMQRDVAVEMEPGMTAGLTIDRRLKGNRLDAPPQREGVPVAMAPMSRKGDRLDRHPQPQAPSIAATTPAPAVAEATPVAPPASAAPVATPVAPDVSPAPAVAEISPAPSPDARANPPDELPSPPPAKGGFQLASADPNPSGLSVPNPAEVPPIDVDRPDENDDSIVAAGGLVPGFVPHDELDPNLRIARLYFGNNPMGDTLGALKPWEGEGPKVETLPVAIDPDTRVASLPAEPSSPGSNADAQPGKQDKLAKHETSKPDESVATKNSEAKSGETIAAKGEVTGADRRPKTPAERLKLDAAGRRKAEKCLANAIYFEARGESVRGQIAVSQVVLNRVFSGKYPTTVCGVVYQNANHRLACQFTFACDGIPDVVKEPDAMERAKKIAADALDGKLWLPEVGKATHYHAYWVHPGWVREMKRLHKLGVHTFYRPRAWGDGSDAPTWGDPTKTAAAAKEL